MTTTTTPTTTSTTTTTTTALLRSLERDFSSKRSVKDCFRRNTTLPASQVKKLLLLNQQNQHQNKNNATTSKTVIVLDQQAFRLSFCNLLTENLGVAKNAYSYSSSLSQKQQQQQDDENKEECSSDSAAYCSSSRSSMWYISKLSTVFYFIQLLWEYETCNNIANCNNKPTAAAAPHNDENDQHANHRPNSSSSSVSSVESSSSRQGASKCNVVDATTAEQANNKKMILQLLRSIAGVACTLCEKHHEQQQILQQQQQQQQQQQGASSATRTEEEDNDNDNNENDECNDICENDDDFYNSNATHTFHGLQVAAFLLMNLIRLNHYVRLRPIFISPLWKAIGDVVTAMQQGTATSNIMMMIPRDIWVHGVTCLSDYLVEGTVPTLRLFCATFASNNLDQLELQQQYEQQDFQTKVLGFLLGRLLVFFKTALVLPSSRNQSQQQHQLQSASSLQHQEMILTKLLDILCILRGVEHAQLASKVDRCIKALLPLAPPGGGGSSSSSSSNHDQQQQQQFQDVVQRLMQCSHKRAVQVLQQANAAATASGAAASDNDLIMDLATPFYFQGHCWLLLQPLQVALDAITATKKADDNDKNDESDSLSSFDKNAFFLEHAEMLFRVMEHVIFCALPACSQDLWTTTIASLLVMDSSNHDSSIRAAAAAAKKSSLKHLLLPRCMNRWWQLLLRYESSLCCSRTSSSDDDDPCQQRRQALHHLLACWLGRAKHPVAREVILVLLHGHVQNLLALETTVAATAAEPLVRLLAKLLYDQRTKLQLRRGLASLFVRLLLHDASQQQQQQPATGTSTAIMTTTVKLCAEQILVDELGQSSHLGTMTTTKTTTPLSTGGAKRKRTRGKSPSSSKPLTAADIMVVGQVISMLPSDSSSRRILAECLQAGLEPNRLGPVTVALLRSDAASEDASTVRDLVVKFSKLWSTPRSTKLNKQAVAGARGAENSSSNSLTSLGVALFRYLYKSCLKSTELQPQQATVLVQAICRVFRCILDSNNNGQQQPLVVVMLEGIRVLRVVSRALSSNTQSAAMEQLARIFHQLLSQKEWTIRAHAMSSLVLFASTVPPAHKKVLPSCLPNNMVSLLQCRLKGSAHQALSTSSPSLSSSDVLSMQRQCAQKMFSLVQFDAGAIPPYGEGSIFPTCSSSVVIPVGSLVVKMKICDNDSAGRTALVIFPPGEQSMEDIAYMQGDKEESYPIEKLHRLQSVQGGYKMYLKE